MDFHGTPVFSMKKVDKSTYFAAGGIFSHRTHHNLLERQEQKLGDQLYDGLQGK
jgi:hypothetical protein